MILYVKDEIAFLSNYLDIDSDFDNVDLNINIGDIMPLIELSIKISNASNTLLEEDIKSIYHELPLDFKYSYYDLCQEEIELFPFEDAIRNKSVLVMNHDWQLEIKFDVLEKSNNDCKNSKVRITSIQLIK